MDRCSPSKAPGRIGPGVVVAEENLKVQISALWPALGEDRDFIVPSLAAATGSLPQSARLLSGGHISLEQLGGIGQLTVCFVKRLTRADRRTVASSNHIPRVPARRGEASWMTRRSPTASTRLAR
jgi:hypothetical protein